MLIPLTQYAKEHGITPDTARQRARRGAFTSAVKMGRDWMIDAEEPLVDLRIKSGKYRDWRNKSVEHRAQD